MVGDGREVDGVKRIGSRQVLVLPQRNPYWRRFVDASEDPTVIHWCRQRVQQFLDSGNSQENVEWLGNETCPSQSDIFFLQSPASLGLLLVVVDL